jgi:hypothetical protein
MQWYVGQGLARVLVMLRCDGIVLNDVEYLKSGKQIESCKILPEAHINLKQPRKQLDDRLDVAMFLH